MWPVGSEATRLLSESVTHPHVRLPVGPQLDVVVDRKSGEPAGEPICPALWESHLRPLFPLGHGAADLDRSWLGPEDARPESLVDPHPRIEEQSVGPPPASVLLDRHERVALLPV